MFNPHRFRPFRVCVLGLAVAGVPSALHVAATPGAPRFVTASLTESLPVAVESPAPALPTPTLIPFAGYGAAPLAAVAVVPPAAPPAPRAVAQASRATVVRAPAPEKLPRMKRSCGYRASIQQRPDLDAEQLRNARAIIDLGQLLGLPPRAEVIALATAYQESWLRNLHWGDRDSLGLFQQRPSQGWGRPKHLLAPNYAAAAFYLPLTRLPHWWRMPLTKAAQAVQASAYPHAYAQWELMAAILVDRQLHVPDAELNCHH
jgi:hypothetical protein